MWSKPGYSEYDFMRMKQDAINHAKEMQHRAVMPSGSVNTGNSTWQGTNNKPPPPAAAEQRCPRCGRIIRDGKHVYNESPPVAATKQTVADERKNSRGFTYETAKAAPAAKRSPSILNDIFNQRKPPNPATKPVPPQDEDCDSPAASSKINIPFLGDIDIDRDFLIVGGMILVLLAEGSDQMLMLALVYILL